MARPSFSEYWMASAELAASRSTCDRAHVGCVLVKDNRQISAGYNGSISGQVHCDQAGHLLVNDRCQRTIHSEMNALLTAARHGISVAGTICFVTHFPCWGCFKALLNAGVNKIVFKEFKLGGYTRATYDAVIACRGQVSITDKAGMDLFLYTPIYEEKSFGPNAFIAANGNDILKQLKLGV